MNQSIKEALDKKFGVRQIGGKGTIRRKKKITGHKLGSKVTEEGRLYTNRVKLINAIALRISTRSKTTEEDDEYSIMKEFYEKELDEFANSIDKWNLLKKSKINYKELKDDRLDFVKNMFLEDRERPIRMKDNIYDSYIKHNFENEFIKECVHDLLNKLYNGLVNKKYLPDTQKDEDDEEDEDEEVRNARKALDTLNLPEIQQNNNEESDDEDVPDLVDFN